MKVLTAIALVGLFTMGAHGVLGSVAEWQVDAAYEEEEDDYDYFPPAYSFRAIDFDDRFDRF